MTEQSDFDGKVAIVTGAGAGIGLAVAQKLADSGAHVVCADINHDSAQESALNISNVGGSANAFVCDVSDARDVCSLVASTQQERGRLDLAFNNAGILGPMGKPIVEVEESEWDRTITINLKSVFLCLKYQVAAMLKNDGGAIVNTSSVTGLIAAPRNPVYGASKHGVVGLTRSVAMQYADRGVRINAICPGIVETGFSDASVREVGLPDYPPPFVPMGRFGKPEEIADLAVWLLSGRSSYLTGEAIGADGGWRHM